MKSLKGIGFFRTIFSSTMGSIGCSCICILVVFISSIHGILKSNISNAFGIRFDWVVNRSELGAVCCFGHDNLDEYWIYFFDSYWGLQSIDSYLYESADIDGAGYFYKLRRITIPMLSPTLFFVITVTIINAFKTFGQIDILTQGGPQNDNEFNCLFNLSRSICELSIWYSKCSSNCLICLHFNDDSIQFKLGERKVHYQ